MNTKMIKMKEKRGIKKEYEYENRRKQKTNFHVVGMVFGLAIIIILILLLVTELNTEASYINVIDSHGNQKATAKITDGMTVVTISDGNNTTVQVNNPSITSSAIVSDQATKSSSGQIIFKSAPKTNVLVQIDKPTNSLLQQGITSDIFAVKIDASEKSKIKEATLNLKIYGYIYKIFRCDDNDWNEATFSCKKWQATSINFNVKDGLVTFKTNSLSAYAGGFITGLPVEIPGSSTLNIQITEPADGSVYQNAPASVTIKATLRSTVAITAGSCMIRGTVGEEAMVMTCDKNFLNCNCNITKTLGVGEYSYYVNANDTNGVGASETRAFIVRVPSSTLSVNFISPTPPNPSILTAPATFYVKARATSNKKITSCKLNGIESYANMELSCYNNYDCNCTQQVTNLGITPGGYDYYVTAQDELISEDTETRHVDVVPDSAPSVSLNLPVNNYQTTSTSVDFNCSATDTDDTKLKTIELWGNWSPRWEVKNTVTLNSPYPSTATLTYTASGLSQGTYKWNCRALDTAGLNAFASSDRTFTIGAAQASCTSMSDTALQSAADSIQISYDPTAQWGGGRIIVSNILSLPSDTRVLLERSVDRTFVSGIAGENIISGQEIMPPSDVNLKYYRVKVYCPSRATRENFTGATFVYFKPNVVMGPNEKGMNWVVNTKYSNSTQIFIESTAIDYVAVWDAQAQVFKGSANIIDDNKIIPLNGMNLKVNSQFGHPIFVNTKGSILEPFVGVLPPKITFTLKPGTKPNGDSNINYVDLPLDTALNLNNPQSLCNSMGLQSDGSGSIASWNPTTQSSAGLSYVCNAGGSLQTLEPGQVYQIKGAVTTSWTQV
jgi:competence protein ComGC